MEVIYADRSSDWMGHAPWIDMPVILTSREKA
jgi:1,2-phenylacetyl-CoA epoxidase catalytic subunit